MIYYIFIDKAFTLIVFLGLLIYFLKMKKTAPTEGLIESMPNTMVINGHAIKKMNSYAITPYLKIVLTEKQLNVFKLIINRNSDEEIENILDISKSSIYAHINRISKRVGAPSGKLGLINWFVKTYHDHPETALES